MELCARDIMQDDDSQHYDVEFYSDNDSNMSILAYVLPQHIRYKLETPFKNPSLMSKIQVSIQQQDNIIKINSFGGKEIKLIIDGRYFTLVRDVQQTEMQRLERKMEYEVENLTVKIEMLTRVASSLTQQLEVLESVVEKQSFELQHKDEQIAELRHLLQDKQCH